LVHLLTALLKDVGAIITGLYIWEFVITLDYEWDVIRGRQPYRWTIWIYSATRLATLMAMVMIQIANNVTTPIDCQVMSTFHVLFPNIVLALSTLLIAIRTIAIWNMNKSIVTLVIGIWVANVAFLIFGVARVRTEWVAALSSCSLPNAEKNKAGIIAVLATDLILFFIMLSGLLRLRRQSGGVLDLGRLLWRQGVIWLLFATVAELTPVVFVCLNLNDALNLVVMAPSATIESIAATRMYRALTGFHPHTDSTTGLETFRKTNLPASNGNLVFRAPIHPDRMGVTVHTTFGQYPSDQSVSLVHTDGQLRDKPHELGVQQDMERGV